MGAAIKRPTCQYKAQLTLTEIKIQEKFCSDTNPATSGPVSTPAVTVQPDATPDRRAAVPSARQTHPDCPGFFMRQADAHLARSGIAPDDPAAASHKDRFLRHGY